MPSQDLVAVMRHAPGRIALALTGALAVALAIHAAQAQEGTGRDGCYFGECDDGQPPRQPRQRPRVPVDEPSYDPGPDDEPPYEPPYRPDYYPQPAMPQVARICLTQYGNCWMAQAIPVGAPCFCPTAFGPIGGIGQ
jgi:hypothetical protein